MFRWRVAASSDVLHSARALNRVSLHDQSSAIRTPLRPAMHGHGTAQRGDPYSPRLTGVRVQKRVHVRLTTAIVSHGVHAA